MYQIPLASVCKHLLTWGAVQALEVTSVFQVPTCTVPGQQIAKAVKLSWQIKEKKPSNSNPGNLTITVSKERVAIWEAWLWANGTGTCLLDVTTRDTANWMLLATGGYSVKENVLKSLCPGKKPPRCGLWPKGETHTRQDGAERLSTFPAQDSGSAQLQLDTQLQVGAGSGHPKTDQPTALMDRGVLGSSKCFPGRR